MKTFKDYLNEFSFNTNSEYIYSKNNKNIIVTNHAVLRSLQRIKQTIPDKLIIKYFDNVIKVLSNKEKGDYLIYSKSLEQGMVFTYRKDTKSNSNEPQPVIVTILPPKHKKPKKGTKRLFVENKNYIEID